MSNRTRKSRSASRGAGRGGRRGRGGGGRGKRRTRSDSSDYSPTDIRSNRYIQDRKNQQIPNIVSDILGGSLLEHKLPSFIVDRWEGK